jgi:hypothetical protein
MTWLFSLFLPGAGSVLGAALSALVALLKMLFDGLANLCAHPVSFAAVCVLTAGALLIGARYGALYDGALAHQAVAACNERVSSLAEQHNRAVAAAVRDALIASKLESSTPQTQPEIIALCAKSSSCRSRH